MVKDIVTEADVAKAVDPMSSVLELSRRRARRGGRATGGLGLRQESGQGGLNYLSLS